MNFPATPLLVVAVKVTSPGAYVVTKPLLLIVAMFSSLEVQVTDLFSASAGVTEAFNWIVPPI